MKPWLNDEGKILSDSEIEKLSQNWNQETWDCYLKETVEVSQKELPLKSFSMSESYSDHRHEEFYAIKRIDLKRNPVLKKFINDLVDAMSEEDRMMIRMIYWEDLSIRRVAQAMEVSKSTIVRRQKKALNKLKREILIAANLKIHPEVL